jgi:hypothetical protein
VEVEGDTDRDCGLIVAVLVIVVKELGLVVTAAAEDQPGRDQVGVGSSQMDSEDSSQGRVAGIEGSQAEKDGTVLSECHHAMEGLAITTAARTSVSERILY